MENSSNALATPLVRKVRPGSAAGITLGALALLILRVCIFPGLPAHSAETGSVHFVDVTVASGINSRHVSSATSLKYLIEAVSGGVGFLDYDNDGWLDIFCVRGAKLADPQPDGQPLDKSDPKYWNRLYRNNRDGTFSDVTEKAGLRGTGYGMGVAAADYDNDGFADLLVTTYGGAYLYHNNRDGAFTDLTKQAGLLTDGWTTSAAFLDYDNDGLLDIFICRYLRWNFDLGKRFCGTKTPGGRAYCHPNEFEPISNYLFKNMGGGKFRDVSRASGIAASEGKALGVAFNDYNGDGLMDISVANDSHAQFLFKNEGGGKFEEVALLAGAAYTEDGQVFAGMGTEFADVDNDGRPDIITTALPHQSYAYFHNTGGGIFEYASVGSRLTEITRLFSGWGMRVFDYDNDGIKDVFFANSHVMDNIELTQPNVQYKQKPLLLKFLENKFVDVSANSGEVFGQRWAARGAAFGDIDNDGDTDIAVVTLDGPLYLLRNEGGSRNRWIGLDLRGTRSNRDGLGAKVILAGPQGSKQHGLATTSGSYLSANDRRVFFGLGQGGAIEELSILWPSGVVQTVANPKPNQILKVEEPSP